MLQSAQDRSRQLQEMVKTVADGLQKVANTLALRKVGKKGQTNVDNVIRGNALAIRKVGNVVRGLNHEGSCKKCHKGP